MRQKTGPLGRYSIEIYPGIAAHYKGQENDVKYHSFYRYTPLYMLVEALLFTLTNCLWKYLEKDSCKPSFRTWTSTAIEKLLIIRDMSLSSTVLLLSIQWRTLQPMLQNITFACFLACWMWWFSLHSHTGSSMKVISSTMDMMLWNTTLNQIIWWSQLAVLGCIKSTHQCTLSFQDKPSAHCSPLAQVELSRTMKSCVICQWILWMIRCLLVSSSGSSF